MKKIFDDQKVPLILSSGSLIGSHRYHGVIPYDDDFDFFIRASNRSWAKKQLANLCKRDESFSCVLDRFGHLQLLIGITNKTRKDYASFVDFFSYSESNRLKANSLESLMFPTIKRPLEGELYDAIANYHGYYSRVYGARTIDECNSYDHEHKPRRKGCKPRKCSDMNSFLPFVVVSETSVARLELGVNASHIRSLYYHRKSYGVFQ